MASHRWINFLFPFFWGGSYFQTNPCCDLEALGYLAYLHPKCAMLVTVAEFSDVLLCETNLPLCPPGLQEYVGIHIHIILIYTCNHAHQFSFRRNAGTYIVAIMLWQCRSNPHLLGGCPVAGMDHPKHTPGCCLSIHPVEPLRQVKSSGTFHLTLEQAAGWISPLAASGNLRWSPRSWHQSRNSLFHLLPWKSTCFCRNSSLAEYPPSGQIIYLLLFGGRGPTRHCRYKMWGWTPDMSIFQGVRPLKIYNLKGGSTLSGTLNFKACHL